jgi:hypothetical protein
MEQDYIFILMGQGMKVIGSSINNMDLVKKTGLIIPHMKDILNVEKRTEAAPSNGPTTLNLMEIAFKTLFKAKEYTSGPTVGNTTETGKIIKCKVKVLLHGQMDASLKEIMILRKKMDLENSHGLMGALLKAPG